MIGNLIFFIITISCIFFYIKRQHTNFFIALFLLFSKCLLLIAPGSIKIEDFGLLICIVLLFHEYTHDKNFFNTKNDSIGKIIKILIYYYFLCAILSSIRGKESLLYSLMIVRFDLFYLSYFIFKKIPLENIFTAFKKILYLNIWGGILYYLQFIGLTGILLGSDSNDGISSGITRYSNAPFLSLPIFLYLITTKEKVKYKLLLIIFYCGLFILPMSRGVLIATIAVCSIYFILKKKIKIKYAIFFCFVFLLFKPIISYRFSSEGSTGTGTLQEIKNATSYFLEKDFTNYNSLAIINDEGTFTFRILLVAERLNYLIHSPTSLILGEGTIHESSNSVKNYNFNVGTVIKNDDDTLHMQQIDTNDISFISHIFRYGLIYLVLYSIFLYLSLKKLTKGEDELFIVALLFLSIKIVQSLGTDGFSTFSGMFFILAILAHSPKQINEK